MRITSVVLAITLASSLALANDKLTMPSAKAPRGTNTELLLPSNYRDWVALAPTMSGMPTHHHQGVVSKVFVEPSAYEGFLKHGAWPNHTVIVLELRDKATRPKTICDGMIGLEVAAKDDAHGPDPWSYYGIIYDRDKETDPKQAKTACANCGEPDMRLAMYFPALRAVIHARPETMQPSEF